MPGAGMPLIVEFAKQQQEQGKPAREAVIQSAKLRIRPILMTSFAFILGVVPLVVASGAGAASRRTMGTAVFGGMVAATALGVFLIPVLYTAVELLVGRTAKAPVPEAEAPASEATAPAPDP